MMSFVSDKPRVLVMMGGPDAERDVSILSGTAIARALREGDAFDVLELIVDKPDPDDIASLPAVDVVFPALHGHWGEGGVLQQMLEDAGISFVGAGSASASLAMDKMRTKTVVSRADVATPLAIEINASDPCRLAPPLVLKPVDDGSSVDIRICHSQPDIDAARAELHPRRSRLMAETFISGRELTVGVIAASPDGPSSEVTLLPIIEIVPSPEVTFYDYDAKYLRADTHYRVAPADLSEAVCYHLNAAAQAAWNAVECRDLARVDFRMDDQGKVWFLEINTMPGFTDHSLLPMAAASIGIDMTDLCERLVRCALMRIETVHAVRA
ncbi:MAG: D-alanine--D-alanine ligase family protein [Phycisphaerales bacterium]